MAKDVVDAAIELHTEYANLAAACLARAAQSLYSVTHLAQLGLNGDAMSVARTIVELAIDIAYIARDPTTLIPMFVDYSHIRNFQLAQAVDRLHGGTVDRDAMRVLRERHDDYIAQNPDSEHNWAGHGLRWRAERVRGDDAWRRQYVQMYELLYADMCGASHSGYTTLKYTLVGDPAAPSIHFGRMSPETKPIMLAFAAMLQMMSTIVDACGIGDRFETRFSELNRLAVAAEQPELPAPENSEQRNDVPDAFAVSNGLWNECHLAYQIVNGPARIALLGEGGGAGRLPVQWRPGYLRLVAWMHSLSQLQSPSDFQAVFAATRSLLEILVDAVLLRHQADAAAQMADWEESAKLKHAQAIRRFYTGKSQIPRDHQEAIAFAERQNTTITARRIARGGSRRINPIILVDGQQITLHVPRM